MLVVSVVWMAWFALTLYFLDKLPAPDRLGPDGTLSVDRAAENPDPLLAAARDALRASVNQPSDQPATPVTAKVPECAPVPPGETAEEEIFALLHSWPEWAYRILETGCAQIDVALPAWFSISDLAEGPVAYDASGLHQVWLDTYLRRDQPGARVYPVVRLAREAWTALPADPAATMLAFADDLARIVADQEFDGLCLAPDSLLADNAATIGTLVAALRGAFAENGTALCLVADLDADLDLLTAMASVVDRLVLRSIDVPLIGSAPAPLVPQDLFARRVATVAGALPREKLVIALGALSYHWSAGEARAHAIPFAEAMRLAARHGGRVRFDAKSGNTQITLTDAAGQPHEIWVLDALSAHNQLRVLRAHGQKAIAVWPVGYEDPGLWTAIAAGARPAAETAALLGPVPIGGYIGYEGDGVFRKLVSEPRIGQRRIELDPASGAIRDAVYDVLPVPYTIQRFGRTAPTEIVLTFDDGPDPLYTDQVLDVLAEKQVPAAFFMVGRNVVMMPEISKRVVSEGHEIGSHTFLHPRMTGSRDLRMHVELTAFQRLVAGTTGHYTILFREPYARGDGPVIGPEAEPMAVIEAAGHLMVGGDIVPIDWEAGDPAQIVAHVRAALEERGGQVIVLHDGGGNRARTVAALPLLIDALHADGYRFVALSDLLGLPRADLMPRASGLNTLFDRISFAGITTIDRAMVWIFWIFILLGALRSVLMLLMAHLRRPHPDRLSHYAPTVTAVIPAYNEAKVIVRSIETVLAADYDTFDVIVVDDGSTDNTSAVVRRAFGTHPRVQLIRQENQGKWMALNAAYAMTESDIVVAIDADTLIRPDAIRKIVEPFRDPQIGAVAGNVRVGNASTLLTRLQSLEYITAQNIERRAAQFYGGIMVVPGAIGAWRAKAVRAAGLYSNETITEDADLTVSIHRAGYRVTYVEDAFSVTEAPARLRDFMKQRLRWTFGMIQTAWKHRRAAREGRSVGLISIPDLFVFGVVIPLMAPLADIVFIGALINLAVDQAMGTPAPQARPDAPSYQVAGYLLLPLLDVLAAFCAFRFQKDAPLSLLWLLPVQRILYRPLLYVTVYRSVGRALTGKLAAWGRMVRTGTVRLHGQTSKAPGAAAGPAAPRAAAAQGPVKTPRSPLQLSHPMIPGSPASD